MRRFAMTLGLVVGLILASGAACADSLTLQPGPVAGKDAQIVADSLSGSNWGNHSHLIDNWMGNLRGIGLIEFDLSAIPLGSTIGSATLSLYHDLNSDLGSRFDVFRVTSAWSEGTVTFDTAPSIDGTAAASMVIPDAGMGVFRTWDVTSLVQGWVDGSFVNHGMWVEEIPVQGSAVAYFTSSDFAASAQRPILAIEFEPVPEPGSLALLGLGACGLLLLRKRRRPG